MIKSYDYSCNSCENLFEVFVSKDDLEAPVCPECGSEGISRILTYAGYTIRGRNNSGTTKPKNSGAFKRSK